MSTSNGSPAAPAAIPDASRLREIAVRADCDPRSVTRFFSDEELRASVSRRIEKAVAELAREDADRATAAQAATSRQATQQSTREAAIAAGLPPGMVEIAVAQGWHLPRGMHI